MVWAYPAWSPAKVGLAKRLLGRGPPAGRSLHLLPLVPRSGRQGALAGSWAKPAPTHAAGGWKRWPARRRARLASPSGCRCVWAWLTSSLPWKRRSRLASSATRRRAAAVPHRQERASAPGVRSSATPVYASLSVGAPPLEMTVATECAGSSSRYARETLFQICNLYFILRFGATLRKVSFNRIHASICWRT